MSDIVWQDPPPAQYKTDWAAFVAEIKKHPGKWAIGRAGLKNGSAMGQQMVKLKRLGCEATTRRQPDGSYALFVRWPEDAS